MIPVQCMRQRNISVAYQAWLDRLDHERTGAEMRPDLGDLPPLPKDALDILFRICSPSFDLPARVTGLAAIRGMVSAPASRRDMYSSHSQLNTLDRIVYFCGIFNIPFPVYRLPWPLLKVEMEWLAGYPNETWEVSKNPKVVVSY